MAKLRRHKGPAGCVKEGEATAHLKQLQPSGHVRGHSGHKGGAEVVGALRAAGGHAPLQRPELRELRTEGGHSVPRAAAEPRHKPRAYVEHAQLLAAAYALLQVAAHACNSKVLWQLMTPEYSLGARQCQDNCAVCLVIVQGLPECVPISKGLADSSHSL